MRRSLTAVLLLGLVVLVAAVSLHLSAWVPPTYAEIRARTGGSSIVLRDRAGIEIQRTRVDLRTRHLGWVELEKISPEFIALVLRAEDKRFLAHRGVDWLAVLGAIKQKIGGGRLRGASTLSMQLVSFLEPGTRSTQRRRGGWAKLRQMRAALQIEKSWSKNQILETYLNLAWFRGELQGLKSAAEGLYRKSPSGLSRAESAILAVSLRTPRGEPSRLEARACALLRRSGHPDCGDLGLAAQQAVGPATVGRGPQWAPHLARRIARFGQGSEVQTTLSSGLQLFATQTLHEQLQSLADQNVHDGAVLVVKNDTGEVLAYVGSSGPLSPAPHVDGVIAKRQAGSTLKSFLYAAAFDSKWLTPATRLEDTAIDIPVERGVYRPRNHDQTFHGMVTVKQALGSSLNVPAVRTLLLYGAENFVEKLRLFGFGLAQSGEYYGPALALGAADVSLWELVGAYRALARRGVYSRLHFLKEESLAPVEAAPVSEAAAYLVTDILSNRDNRALSFGFENALATPFFTAAKTGTSKDMRDNWCVGYSDTYTVGVWIGNFSGEPMWRVSGVSGAAPIWRQVMRSLHEEKTSLRPAPPAGVEKIQDQWTLVGVSPDSRVSARSVARRITYPAAETYIAIDPDIPDEDEKVFFEAEGTNHSWRLDGKRLAGNGWHPVAGRHVLELIDEQTKVLDKIAFTVK